MKRKTNKAVFNNVERDTSERIAKMYKAIPTRKGERAIERTLAKKLGGPLAEAFFS